VANVNAPPNPVNSKKNDKGKKFTLLIVGLEVVPILKLFLSEITPSYFYILEFKLFALAIIVITIAIAIRGSNSNSSNNNDHQDRDTKLLCIPANRPNGNSNSKQQQQPQ
jgi:hypothetical protein